VGRTGNSRLFRKKPAKNPAKIPSKFRRRPAMNKLLIMGLPIAKSALYERHSALTKTLKSKILKRNNHTMSCISSLRQNMHINQSDGHARVVPVKVREISREEFLFSS
jgi:hypothetical protein